MTGGFDVKFEQICAKDETVVSVNLHSVLTDGTFIPLPEPEEDPSHAKKELYQCVDKVEADDQSKIVAKIYFGGQILFVLFFRRTGQNTL